MTQEEKAKAYDRALEKAKKTLELSSANEIAKTVVYYFFPELRESEDERIRKGLIEALKTSKTVGELKFILPEPIREECITWLEKQKEQNLELYYDKELDSAAREFYFSGGADSPFDSTGLMHIVRMAEFGATWMKKKMEKEQIPAEWSEEDVDMLNSCISSIEEAKENRYAYKETDGDTSYDYEIAWLKSLRPSWRPSEEDIKMLEHIIGQYETGNKNSKVVGYLPRVEELSFLKNVLSKWKN